MLAAFDAQVRRGAPAPDEIVERDDRVVRRVSRGGGWSGVTWTDLGGADADAVIAAQIARFAPLSRPWEWKHFSYDAPDDLPARLRAAGFVAEPSEAVLVAEAARIAGLASATPAPDGVEVVDVVDRQGVDALVAVHEAVFGGDYEATGRALAEGIARRPPTDAAVVATAGGVPVAAARLELAAGGDFAGLWGGGTLPEWRGRGVFRALVARRAALASARGYRYVQVDALPSSRPILERLGFVHLATTTPFTHPGG